MKPANQPRQFLSTHTCYLPRHPDVRYPNTGQMLQDNASQQLSTILSATSSAAGNHYMGPRQSCLQTPSQPCPACPPGSPVGRNKKQQYLNANEQTLQSHTSSSFLHTDTFFFSACTQNQKEVVSEQRDLQSPREPVISSLQHQALPKPDHSPQPCTESMQPTTSQQKNTFCETFCYQQSRVEDGVRRRRSGVCMAAGRMLGQAQSIPFRTIK